MDSKGKSKVKKIEGEGLIIISRGWENYQPQPRQIQSVNMKKKKGFLNYSENSGRPVLFNISFDYLIFDSGISPELRKSYNSQTSILEGDFI